MAKEDDKKISVFDADGPIQVPADLDAAQQQIAVQPNEQSPLAPPPAPRQMSETTACDTAKTAAATGAKIAVGAAIGGGISLLCCPSSMAAQTIVTISTAICSMFAKPAVISCINSCDSTRPVFLGN